MGLANGIVKTFDVSKKEFIAERSHSIGEGKLKGLFKWERLVIDSLRGNWVGNIFEETFSLADVVHLSHTGVHVQLMRSNVLINLFLFHTFLYWGQNELFTEFFFWILQSVNSSNNNVCVEIAAVITLGLSIWSRHKIVLFVRYVSNTRES